MAGGLGDDFFLVETAGDIVIEAAGEGHDRILSRLDLSLPEWVEVGNLTDAAGDGSVVGNVLDNTLIGNTFDNSLVGGDNLISKAGGPLGQTRRPSR